MVSQRTACLSFVLIYCALWATCAFSAALSCDSCGRECASACGTRHFRTCCFNYLRKRSSTPPLAPPHHLTNSIEFPWTVAGKSRVHEMLEPLDSRQSYDNTDLLEYVEVIHGDGGGGQADNKRNSLIASHSSGHMALGKFRRPRPGTDQDGRSEANHESELKTSEETDPGRLQLLYDA